jgi:hypothetical protein
MDVNAETDRLIAQFVKASNEVEQYLHHGGSLTPLQYQTITTTVMGLRTFIERWISERKPGFPPPGVTGL